MGNLFEEHFSYVKVTDDLGLNSRLENGKMKPHKLVQSSMKVRFIQEPQDSNRI